MEPGPQGKACHWDGRGGLVCKGRTWILGLLQYVRKGAASLDPGLTGASLELNGSGASIHGEWSRA